MENKRIGEIITFGKYDWRILEAKKDKMLIITDNIIIKQPYHKPRGKVTWEKCTLRDYLNREFYNSFDSTDKNKIVRITNKNQNNQWWKTPGGNPTQDYVFLLSLEEVAQYLGDISALKTKGTQIYYIDDGCDNLRMSKHGFFWAWWWLRSPGSIDYVAAYVLADGSVSVNGCNVYLDAGGVRPALWISLT